MTVCWRCKKDFEPEQSPFWPNMKETCADCVKAVLPEARRLVFGDVPDKLLADVMKASEVEQAEKIIGGKR